MGKIVSKRAARAVCASALLVCASARGQSVPVDSASVSPPCTHPGDDGSVGEASQRIYRDPRTGKVGPPPPGALPAPAEKSFNTSHEGLVEEPGKSRAGGVTVNLKGRFRSAVVHGTDAQGQPATRCVSNLPGSNEKE